ncbi:alkaline-phosphatase-like protein [Coniochaeta sp. 2T2.1]|nr:alkaline-phosphatase-like protein [Coniochaeta sp. 2T2.1]
MVSSITSADQSFSMSDQKSQSLSALSRQFAVQKSTHRPHAWLLQSQGHKTPHVDRLAAEGTKFTHAFASTASCSGSRSTIYTVFNSLGYQTGIIGKVHVGPRTVYPWEWYAPSLSRDVRADAAEAGRFLDNAAATDHPFHLTVGLRDPHRDETRGGFGNDEEDTTLVIFVSDNGAPFLNSKMTLYDAGVRLPLLVRQPGSNPGVVNPNMVSFVDILPSCIAWATGHGDSRIETANTGRSPKRLGNPFLPILGVDEVVPDTTWAQHIFGSHTFHEIQNYWPTRFLRDRRLKYHRNIAWRLDFPFATDLYSSLSWEGIRNATAPEEESSGAGGDTPEVMIGRRRLRNYVFRGPEELFDLDNDPEEVCNLAGRPEFEGVLKKMRATLEDWQYQTDDVWLFKDGVSAITTQGAQKLGLKLPDRFDFDVESPANAAGPHWAPRSDKAGASSLVEYG